MKSCFFIIVFSLLQCFSYKEFGIKKCTAITNCPSQRMNRIETEPQKSKKNFFFYECSLVLSKQMKSLCHSSQIMSVYLSQSKSIIFLRKLIFKAFEHSLYLAHSSEKNLHTKICDCTREMYNYRELTQIKHRK